MTKVRKETCLDLSTLPVLKNYALGFTAVKVIDAILSSQGENGPGHSKANDLIFDFDLDLKMDVMVSLEASSP